MTRIATRITAGLSGLAALALLGAMPAAADSNSMQEEITYSNYHRAIRAAELCEDRAFGMTDHEKMGEVIDQKIHYAIGAGKRRPHIPTTTPSPPPRLAGPRPFIPSSTLRSCATPPEAHRAGGAIDLGLAWQLCGSRGKHPLRRGSQWPARR